MHDPDLDLAVNILRRYGDILERVRQGDQRYHQPLEDILEQGAALFDILSETRDLDPERYERALDSGVIGAMAALKDAKVNGYEMPTVYRGGP